MALDRRLLALGCLTTSIVLGLALVKMSNQQGSGYNPWLDYDDNGIIDVFDLEALGQTYGYSGTPLNLPMALEYDSGWLDISDKQGQNITITHNLSPTATYLPRIWGRTLADGSLHQRHFDGTGSPPGWNKTHGEYYEDCAYSVVQTADGGYAMAGYTLSYGTWGAGSWDCLLIKTDSSGNQLWNRTYGGSNIDYAHSLVQTADGGYALAGYTYSYGVGTPSYTNLYLVKTDSVGNMEWNKTIGGIRTDEARSLVQTSDGGYALAGYTNSYGINPPYYNAWLVRTDSAGNHLWNRTYGGADFDIAFSLAKTADNGYILAGRTQSYGAGTPAYNNCYLVKTDSSGTFQWNKTYGGAYDDYTLSVIKTVDNGYALAGYTYSYGAGTPSYANPYLVKTDSGGNMQWEKTYGGAEWEDAVSVVQTGDGGYALAGRTLRTGTEDFLLIKTDSAGNHLWNETYGEIPNDRAYSLVQTADGGYAVAGTTKSYGATNYDFWLVKTDAMGQTKFPEIGLAIAGYTADAIILYRGAIDPYWNYVRVRIWVVKETP